MIKNDSALKRPLFTLYSSSRREVKSNCNYPNKHIITDEASLANAVSYDYVLAEYRDGHRSSDNFVKSDCLAMDVDNDHSDLKEEWVTVEDIKNVFPGVTFALHYSRSNMKAKNGKSPRPKFHLLFPIDEVTDKNEYASMKKKVKELFPFVDANALDAARFFFGTDEAKVEIHIGEMNLTSFFQLYDKVEQDVGAVGAGGAVGAVGAVGVGAVVIPEGQRSNFLISYANKVLKRYGNTENARLRFDSKAEQCEPPLEEFELNTIWNSAVRFYVNKISKEPGYIAPDEFDSASSYKPDDFTDVGQAKVLAKYFKDFLRYSPATSFICYSNSHWQESEPGAQAMAQELTNRQLVEANSMIDKSRSRLEELGADELLSTVGKSKALLMMDEVQAKAYREYTDALTYKNFVLKRRDTRTITGALKEVRPLLALDPKDLDSDPFALCTPDGTYDLRSGKCHESSPSDLNTKITSVAPDKKGEQIWLDALNTIFMGDKELISYVQKVCGLAAIGKVYVEALIIAYGSGRNGKSTFWNAISRVLGLYSGNVSADTLTVGCHRNIKPEMAEIRGKRLLIAAEMQEGARLNDSTVKQLCSTDEVFAEKKYKDPFAFTPCHTAVLYTNHLPRVSATDEGVWRRLIVIPFNAKIEGSKDIKNYADYLYENAGGAILSWIIEGAKSVIEDNYSIKVPASVLNASEAYHDNNDWLQRFLDDKCEIGEKKRASSSELYKVYKSWCFENNEYVRYNQDFYAALMNAGFERLTLDRKRYITGLSIKEERVCI